MVRYLCLENSGHLRPSKCQLVGHDELNVL
jgi:hypothetical protein